jgi:ABC-2 type transport system permease protein
LRKTLIVAASEFGTLARSKAFIISVVLMPVVMGGSIFLVRATKNATDGKDRTFAVVDYTGVLAGPLIEVASAMNAGIGAPEGRPLGPKFIPQEVKPQGRDVEALRLELSDHVRRGELFAFVEIPAGILDSTSGEQIRYYSDHPSYAALPQWLRTTVNGVILNERFRTSSLDRTVVTRLTKPAPLENLGLFDRGEAGTVKPAEQVDEVRTFGLPSVLLVLMYITVMSSSPQLLNSVIEEKMSRISEVLIASVTPFQLMMGKLLGSVSVSVLLALIYFAGGLAVAHYWGYGDAVTPATLLWFVLFLILAVLMFGSIFIAIGAACTDLKDSQNMMTPAMLLVMLPVLTWVTVLRAPDGLVATVLSLTPTATPFLMLLRISLPPGPPAWQIVLAFVLTTGSAVVMVWAAGKIFRTGLLMQGKSATLPEMVRWIRA